MPRPKVDRVAFMVRLPREVHEAISALAERSDVSLNALMTISASYFCERFQSVAVARPFPAVGSEHPARALWSLRDEVEPRFKK